MPQATGKKVLLRMNKTAKHHESQPREETEPDRDPGQTESSSDDQDAAGAAEPMSRQITTMTAHGMERGNIFGDQVRAIGAGERTRNARPSNGSYAEEPIPLVSYEDLIEGDPEEVERYLRERESNKKRQIPDSEYDQAAVLRVSAKKLRKDQAYDLEKPRRKRAKPAPQTPRNDSDGSDGDDESGAGKQVSRIKPAGLAAPLSITSAERLTEVLMRVTKGENMWISVYSDRYARHVVALDEHQIKEFVPSHNSVVIALHALVHTNPGNIFGPETMRTQKSMQRVSRLLTSISPDRILEVVHNEASFKFATLASTVPKGIVNKVEQLSVVSFAENNIPADQVCAAQIVSMLDNRPFAKEYRKRNGTRHNLQADAKLLAQLYPDEEVASAIFAERKRLHVMLGRNKDTRATRNAEVMSLLALGVITDEENDELKRIESEAFCFEFSPLIFDRDQNGVEHDDEEVNDMLAWRRMLVADKVLSESRVSELQVNVRQALAYMDSFLADADDSKARSVAEMRRDQTVDDIFYYLPDALGHLNQTNKVTLALNQLNMKNASRWNVRAFHQVVRDEFDARKEDSLNNPKHGDWVGKMFRVMSENPGCTKEMIHFSLHKSAMNEEGDVPPAFDKLCTEALGLFCGILDDKIERFVDGRAGWGPDEMTSCEYIHAVILDSIEAAIARRDEGNYDPDDLQALHKMGLLLDSDRFEQLADKTAADLILLLFQCITEHRAVTERSIFIRVMSVELFQEALVSLTEVFRRCDFVMADGIRHATAAYSMLLVLFDSCANWKTKEIYKLRNSQPQKYKMIFCYPSITVEASSSDSDQPPPAARGPAPAAARKPAPAREPAPAAARTGAGHWQVTGSHGG
jgi:hypothetical protein